MEKYCIPFEQALGMITSAKLEETVMVTEKIENIQMMAIVTAGTGHNKRSVSEMNGTINMMLFIDAHFTDGALVDGYMSASEAKVKALQDLNIVDSPTGTSTDTLVIGLTQQGRNKIRWFRNDCRKRNWPNRVSCHKGSVQKDRRRSNQGLIEFC